ncbi:non-canonical purine NTP pyrophosphatase [bacterium]|nr:non-canonical purine NTP pyrophosphatase [bacterium]
MDFILASSNNHKIAEFNEFFKDSKINILCPENKISVLEDGSSFRENALKKAKSYFDKFQKPVLSDDSGLIVNSLSGELGIYSARFGGEGLNDKERAELLLQSLEGKADRSAYFICVLCFFLSDSEVYFFEGRSHGEIIHLYEGEDAFGYDPVFRGITQKEGYNFHNDKEYKDQHSHRYLAVKNALAFDLLAQ